jgi:hypothetical protein
LLGAGFYQSGLTDERDGVEMSYPCWVSLRSTQPAISVYPAISTGKHDFDAASIAI